MPIRGLTDNTAPRFPRLGKLRKGDERPEAGNMPGKELPYWRFTSENPEIEAAFVKSYGDKPTELEVFLPYVALDDNWQTWQEEWAAGGLQHRCNGQFCVVWLEGNSYVQDPTMSLHQRCPGGCKQVGRLSVVLIPLVRCGFWGHVTMETHSIHDLLSIQGTLNAVAGVRDNLQEIPFMLRRVEREISTPDPKGKRVLRKKYMVELVLLAEWARAQLLAAEDIPLLEEEETVDEETGEIVDWSVLQGDMWQKFLAAAMKAFSRPWREIVEAIQTEPELAVPYTAEIGASAKAHLAATFAEMPKER